MVRGRRQEPRRRGLPDGVNNGTIDPDEAERLLEPLRRNPAGVRFEEACRVATAFFGAPRQRGTSHVVWRMPWAGDPRVNLQRGRGGQAKPYQVRQLVRAASRLLEEPSP